MFPQALRTRCFFRSFSHRRATFCLVRPPPRMVKYRAYRKNRTRPRRESFSLPGLIGEEPVWKTVHFRSLAAMCSTTAPCARGCRRNVYQSLRRIRDEGEQWDPRVADVVADAMKNWAMQLGATHYIHWFIPLTGAGAGKHDSFIDGVRRANPSPAFSGKMLAKGESDASVLPFGRAARHLRGARLHRVGPNLPRLCAGHHAVHSHRLLRLHRRSAGPENPLAAQHSGAEPTGAARAARAGRHRNRLCTAHCRRGAGIFPCGQGPVRPPP